MAKKKEPEKQGNEELFLALDLLEKEKGIPAEYMLCLLYTSPSPRDA